jgi:hypothetical protein
MSRMWFSGTASTMTPLHIAHGGVTPSSRRVVFLHHDHTGSLTASAEVPKSQVFTRAQVLYARVPMVQVPMVQVPMVQVPKAQARTALSDKSAQLSLPPTEFRLRSSEPAPVSLLHRSRQAAQLRTCLGLRVTPIRASNKLRATPNEGGVDMFAAHFVWVVCCLWLCLYSSQVKSSQVKSSQVKSSQVGDESCSWAERSRLAIITK